MNAIVDELRRKFRTPKDALRALGLDEGLLDGKPKKRAVASALRSAIKAKTGIAEDAALADLLDLLDALKQSEEGHVSEIDKAEAAAKEAFGLGGGGEGGESEVGAAQEHTDEFEPDPKPAPKPEAKQPEAKPELKPEPKKDSEMAGLATTPNGSVPALAEKDEEARDEGMEEGIVSDDPATKLHAILKDKLSPEELKQVGEVLLELAGGEAVEGADEAEEEAEDESEEEKEEAKDEDIDVNGVKVSSKNDDGPKVVKTGGKEGESAMDAAMVKGLIAQAVAANDARHIGIRKAMAHVKRSPVGELAMDEGWKSADDVYRAALKVAGIPKVEGIHASALPAILDLVPRAGASAPASRRESNLGMDAKTAEGFNSRFPALARIQH